MNHQTKIGTCPKCEGVGKIKGLIFTRQCDMCRGTGAQHCDLTITTCVCGWTDDKFELQHTGWKMADHLKQAAAALEPPLHLTGQVYNAWEHQGWGDRIGTFKGDSRHIDGHLTPRPSVGDEIRYRMESGKIARFAITNVEWVPSVRDMFFADLMDIGYVGEPPVNKVREAKP